MALPYKVNFFKSYQSNGPGEKGRNTKSKGPRAKGQEQRAKSVVLFALSPLRGMCFSALFLYNCHHFPEMKSLNPKLE
jgi:hypothetical protein